MTHHHYVSPLFAPLQRLIIAALICSSVGRCADSVKVPIRQRVVDVVILQNGTRLLGTTLPRRNTGTISVLLRGEWLQQHAPQLFGQLQTAVNTDGPSQNSVVPLLASHIKSLEMGAQGDIERLGFLKERLQNLQTSPATKVAPDLMIVDIADKLVRRKLLQKPEVRELAGLGILNSVAHVESLSQAAVRAELQQRPPTDLVRGLPATAASHAEDDFRRLLLRTDCIFGRTCRLIYHNQRYVAEGDTSANPEQLAVELLVGQVQSQVSAVLNPHVTATASQAKSVEAVPLPGQTLPASAARIAAQQQADVVEVSELQLRANSGSAGVRIDLYHRDADAANWQFVVRVTGTATPRDISVQQQQSVANDPRVRQVTQLFGHLGATSGDLATAISMGAVVEVAQQRAKAKLQAFLSAAGTTAANRASVQRTSLTELP